MTEALIGGTIISPEEVAAVVDSEEAAEVEVEEAAAASVVAEMVALEEEERAVVDLEVAVVAAVILESREAGLAAGLTKVVSAAHRRRLKSAFQKM